MLIILIFYCVWWVFKILLKISTNCVSCCRITRNNSSHFILFCQKLIPKKLSPSSIGWNTHESQIGGTWWRSTLIKTFKFPKKKLCLCLILCKFHQWMKTFNYRSMIFHPTLNFLIVPIVLPNHHVFHQLVV